jgi:hypothetical protein
MLEKNNKIKILFYKISSLFLYLVLLAVFLEFSAGVALKLYYKIQRGSTNFSFLGKELKAELAEVQMQADLNLYRWYSNKPNFKGNFITTDASGFRIDKQSLDARSKVGMFGGSTTFSVLTNQKGTIASQLSQLSNRFQILNFGVGGYSTSAEIMTFVEAIRGYPDMRHAIFYDGINELGRQVESDKQKDVLETYKLIGNPYVAGEFDAIKKKIGLGINLQYTKIYYLYHRILSKIKIKLFSIDNKIYNRSHDKVINRYFENLKTIKGICDIYQIKCFFVWQPSIFTTNPKVLNEREINIMKNMAKLTEWDMSNYADLTKKIFKDPRSQSLNLIDLTDALDNKNNSKRAYQDWCHLNANGNKLVANALFNKIISITE